MVIAPFYKDYWDTWVQGKREGTPMKFRKRVLIEAYQYTGNEPMVIQTLEGPLIAKPMDWIATGVDGEKRPIDNTIFHKTYELVEENQPKEKE